jgi:fumarate hydratase subunit alpha
VRELPVSEITAAVARLAEEACCDLGEDVLGFLRSAREREESPVGREVFAQLLENAEIARRDRLPLCQDTGLAVVFLEVGQEVHLAGGDLEDAVDAGVRRGYEEGYLRKSSVAAPFAERSNTKDNTPAVLHLRIVPGDRVKVTLAPKGGGAENMSALSMLKPSQGRQGVVDFVLRTVSEAGSNACPPMVVGVGVGGTFERVAFLAKKALLREIGSVNPLDRLAELEDELESRCNDLGIGPQGLGGRITVMDVFVEEAPAHIASLPVAVNIQCHSARHKEEVL